MAKNLREFYGELSEGILPLLDVGCPSSFLLFKKRVEGGVSLPVPISKSIVSHEVF